MSAAPHLPEAVRRNVELITQVEHQLHRDRSGIERFGDRIARYFGSFAFICAHSVFIAAWVLLNVGMIPALPAFDPYPFSFLALVVAVEFIFLTTFVLMNQAHQMRRTEQWAMLTLQMCLLSEQEQTRSLELLRLVCLELGLQKPALDPENRELARPTDVAALVERISKPAAEPADQEPEPAPTPD